MIEKRVNPETGVLEEKRWHGWTPCANAEGHEERVNPETGVHEEKRWHGWTARENAEGREERVNPETGAHEEKRWHGWTPREGSPGSPRRSPLGSARPHQRGSADSDISTSSTDSSSDSYSSSAAGSSYSSSSAAATKPRAGGIGGLGFVLWIVGSCVGGYVSTQLIQNSAEFSLAWWFGGLLGLACLPGYLVALLILLVIVIAFYICYGLYELVKYFISHPY